jgi:hypothetical protein
LPFILERLHRLMWSLLVTKAFGRSVLVGSRSHISPTSDASSGLADGELCTVYNLGRQT